MNIKNNSSSLSLQNKENSITIDDPQNQQQQQIQLHSQSQLQFNSLDYLSETLIQEILKMNKYTIVKVIGVGSEAKAILVKKIDTDQMFVIKQRNFTNMDMGVNEGLNEAMLLASLQHQNIARFEEVFIVNNGPTSYSLCIVMEYCSGGDLMEFMINLILAGTGLSDNNSNKDPLQLREQTSFDQQLYQPQSCSLNNSPNILSQISLGGGNGINGAGGNGDIEYYDDNDLSEDEEYTTSYSTTTTTTSSSYTTSDLVSPLSISESSPNLSQIPEVDLSPQQSSLTHSGLYLEQHNYQLQIQQQIEQQQQLQLQFQQQQQQLSQQQTKKSSWYKSSRKRSKEAKDFSISEEPMIPPLSPTINYGNKKTRILIPSKVLYNWIYQLCLGVHQIHSSHFIHRDLKSENIFLHEYQIKIGDFGLATKFESSVKGIAGTFYYSSPEVLSNQSYCRPADIFSLGCIIYEMTTLHLLPLTKRCIAEELIAGTFDPVRFKKEFPTEHYELADLVIKMLDFNPEVRPSIDLILQNKIFEVFKRPISMVIEASPSEIVPSVSTFSISPQGGFRKQLDKSDLPKAAMILAEGYDADPRFSWIKPSKKKKKQSQSESTSTRDRKFYSQNKFNITSQDSLKMDPNKKDGANELKMDDKFVLRKIFFDSGLKIMFSERFLLWGYYNSQNILNGVACWMTPDCRKRVPFTNILLKMITLLPKLGLLNSKRIKDLMDAIDKIMEKTNADGQHYHLAYCAVSKESRSKGIGQYLLAPVLEWCDFSNRMCKALIFKQRSIPFFQKLGFEVSTEVRDDSLPKGINVIWAMERKPRPRENINIFNK